jgi:membrane protein insertase Oxa1/YidC/SpoIIIJ
MFVAFYSAVRQTALVGGRFLWIPNIAKRDLWLSVAVAGITFLSLLVSRTSMPPETSRLLLVVPVVIMGVVLLKTSAGVALYFGVSSAAQMAENYLVRRTRLSARSA